MSGADGRSSPHGPDGFRNPWLERDPGDQRGALLKWQWQRLRTGWPKPPPGNVPHAEPKLALPRAAADELRVTWIGQASFLVQVGGLNLLTDPVFSERASPVSWAGPRRIAAPGLTLDRLPPIDGVLISHDHYDHLDDPSVRALHARYGERLRWFAPLGFSPWFARRGITSVTELDWWGEAELEATIGQAADDQATVGETTVGEVAPAVGQATVTALPAQHWTRRGPRDDERLWCSWSVRSPAAHVYFAGDSGYCPGFAEIGREVGPFDLSLLPIGAYEPRWFMKPAHMNPEEAVQSYLDLGGRGAFVGMHWGTFILTDEPVLEPPERVRAAWSERGLPADELWLLVPGETRYRRMRAGEGAAGEEGR